MNLLRHLHVELISRDAEIKALSEDLSESERQVSMLRERAE
jgi:hypothetical protein